MTANEITFLFLALSAFSLFGGVLGWAFWMQSHTGEKSSK